MREPELRDQTPHDRPVSSAAAAPLRSLHVSDLTDSGGAEAVFADTVRAAETLGHQVTTVVSDGRRSALSFLFSLRWYRRMRSVLSEVRPDVVHLQNYYRFLSPSVLLAIRHHRREQPGLAVVHTAHDYHLVCPNSGLQHFPRGVRTTFDPATSKIPALARFDDRTIVHSALKSAEHLLAYRLLRLHTELDLVLSPSQYLRTVVDNCRPEVPTELLRNPVHPLGSTAPDPLDRPGDGTLRLVYLGRIAPEKGLIEFARAVDRILIAADDQRAVELDVYGTGAAVPALTRCSRTLQRLRLRLLPRVPRRRVGEVLVGYHGFVYPSIWPENAPIAVIEAITAGLPVLVPRGTGAAEMAELSRQRVLFDATDPESIATGIRTLEGFSGRNELRDPDEFSMDRFTERLGAIYHDVIARRREGRST